MKLKEYKMLFMELIRYIHEGVHVIDSDGKTIIYNERMADLEKLTGKEVINKPFQDVFKDVEDSTLLKSLNTRTVIENKNQAYINKYGKEITTINTTIPIIDDNKVVAALEIAQNITQIKEMTDTILELQKDIHQPSENKNLRIKQYRFHNITGGSKAFKKTLEIAKRASKTDASVFIYGETGTGKELIAQSIHFDGIRKTRPFIAQNCAAIPDSLLEGLLFGTDKGGFTGAVDREGLFEQASGGTLLLDEINSMPYDTQAKLLRVLQEGYVRRIGGTKDIPIDVRIIASSNEPADVIINSGKIRKDLFYRLNIISINIPPLRERKDDIMPLCEKFIEKYNEKLNKDVWILSDKAKEKLLAHDYPGNIRELENIIVGAISLLDDEHVISDSFVNIHSVSEFKKNTIDYKNDVKEMGLMNIVDSIEKDIIYTLYAESGRNITKTADALKIKRQTLQHKLRKYDIR
ncbi:sigma-54 interaction domain-containing protein [Proteocatella sphenisci]|uniref:sigma-54 interaction domain-containing protein n=1 Tax=Proteocatella sphenisci TaxID=181070 RepID=UPI000490D57C|nr:sigma 54-interacting transcriptional regulator [Proteocatella sphenisci]